MLTLPLERKISAIRIYTDPSIDLGEKHLHYFTGKELDWFLDFRFYRFNSVNTVKFSDTLSLTNRLVSELIFNSKLYDVYELRVKQLEVRFSYESSSKYEERKHLVCLHGSGYHSFISSKASDFTYETYTSEVMMQLTNSLCDLATKDLS